MSNTFITSDTHFSHRGICNFLRADDITKERPWDNIEEMDEALVNNWNSVVRPKDTVYHLGDVVINRSALPILSRLNGTKILIMGNHDVFRPEEYLQYFKSIHGSKVLDGFLLTHMPVHIDSIGRWDGNLHGHLHSGSVMEQYDDFSCHEQGIDTNYMCLSVEHTDFTPISLEDAKKKFKGQQ